MSFPDQVWIGTATMIVAASGLVWLGLNHFGVKSRIAFPICALCACILGAGVWHLWPPHASSPISTQPTQRQFTLAAPPPRIERDTANEKIEIGIFYQGDDLQSDAEKVAGALNAAGYKLQHGQVSLENVIYRGTRAHKVNVVIKSTAELHKMRGGVRDLALKALLDRVPNDVVIVDDDLFYGGRTPDRGVIQVDLF